MPKVVGQDKRVAKEKACKHKRLHREIKTHLKKLSALQYRLKHKIAARG